MESRFVCATPVQAISSPTELKLVLKRWCCNRHSSSKEPHVRYFVAPATFHHCCCYCTKGTSSVSDITSAATINKFRAPQMKIVEKTCGFKRPSSVIARSYSFESLSAVILAGFVGFGKSHHGKRSTGFCMTNCTASFRCVFE